MTLNRLGRISLWALLAVGTLVIGHPFPGYWDSGAGGAIHYQPVQWPTAPSPALCGASCGDWKPYTRFGQGVADARVQDPSNGGTAPQNYVNVASSCTDKTRPSIYYYLHKAADPADDVVMFRWRVEQPAHTYAAGPSAGNYSASNPWNSAQWTVLFNLDGSGYRSLAAHLNGSSGSPSQPIDMLAGIWSNTTHQSIDYSQPNVHLLAHNPTAFIGPSNKLMNFHNTLTPDESWPNGAAETTWDYGTTRASLISTSPCNEYFIDYQIPVAMLDATGVGGPKITRDTPISMLFCTANSLSNPFQKDCAINRQWTASEVAPAPFGDYLSFNKEEPYRQPIVSSVTATAPQSCPGSYTLTSKIQDALAVQGGVVTHTVQSVQFYYWYDRNGDGEATAADSDSAWTAIASPATVSGSSLNTWTASWDATSLPKGKYLIGVQAVDDATMVDDGMTVTGVDNRTFSYLSGDGENRIYNAGAWIAGQQASFPSHSPTPTPSGVEDWYGNPSVTGVQLAVVGTAINACGVAPTLSLSATPSVAAGGTVNFTMTITNPAANSSAIAVDEISDLLPDGFSYLTGTTSGTGGLPSSNPSIGGQLLTWTLGSPLALAPGASATLTFSASASSTAGSYNSTSYATTSFGDLTSDPASIVVDTARLSLSITPSAYSIAANGTSQLTYTINYANDSGVIVSGASIANIVPVGVTYVSCSGGTSCSESSGTATWTLGTLGGGASGSVTMVITVPFSYSQYSLSNSATLTATAPDSSTATKTASTTVAVTGIAGSTSPAFTLSKVANVAAIAPGGSVTYTLSYQNYGTGDATGVVITDTLPAGMTYNSCTGGCGHSSGSVTWNIGSVVAGASGSVTVTVAAASPFTAVNPAVNNANIAWTGGSPVAADADVGVTGQSCSTYYFRNTTASVGFDGTRRIANASPVPISGDTGTVVAATAPVSGAAFLEVLRFYQDPQTENNVPFDGNITSNIYIDRANGQGLNIRATVYDYNSTTGATTSLGQNTVLFNGSTKGLLSVTVTPSGTLQKGHRLLWVYEARSAHNSQTVEVQFQFDGTVSNGISGGTTFANSNATYCITPPANLTLSNSVSASSVDEGTTPTLTYTLRYSNLGSASATNTTLTGALPSGFTSCEYSTNNSTWNTCSASGSSPPSHAFSLGSVAGGASGTVYVRGVVPAGTDGGDTLVSTSSIVSDQTTAQTDIATTYVAETGGGGGGTPELTLILSADRTTAQAGESVVYTATAINTGSAAATNVAVSNTVPSNVYYGYSSCTGSCNVVGSALTWPTIASLAPGGSQSVSYTMLVATSGLPAGITAIADDASVSGDGGLSATSNTASVAINGNPALVLTNNASPSTGLEPGDDIVYTLTVSNTGAADASTVVVTSPITGNTNFKGAITASQGSGSFDAVGNRVVFNVGTLSSGATVTLSFTVTIVPTLPSGNTTLTNTATADSSNAAQQVTAATASASAAPVLSIGKSAPTSVAYPSAVLTAAANGTTLFVDRTDRLSVDQLIQVGGSVARIVSLGAKHIVVDSSIAAASGTGVNGALGFSVTYSNTGNAIASGVVIQEPLAAGFGYYSSSPSATTSPASGSSGAVTWNVGSLAAGTHGTVQVIAFPVGTTGSFTNISSISADNATTATASSTTQIGGLTVSKSTSTSVVSAGATATYTIVISNSLGSIASPVSVTDKLPQGFSYHAGSATVGGSSVEPSFDVDDTDNIQPTWSGLSIPAGGSLTISFQADVANATGAGGYQNELDVSAPAGVGLMNFDPLLTTAEDVNVLAAASGVLKGYVFSRPSGNALTFDPVTDTPLTGVRVEIHKAGADCDNPIGGNCVVAYTDSNGYFERSIPAEDWLVSVKENTGDLPNGWYQIAGTNGNTVTVPDQNVVWDYNGFSSSAPVTYTVSASAGANGSMSPASRTVNDGDTTTFTVTPNSGYYIDTVSGCGGSLSGSTYTTGAIAANCAVTATFAATPPTMHTVNATAGSGGSISPASNSVPDGNATSFTVTPDSGFIIASVSGCGGSLSGGTYTTAPISAACTVTATFALPASHTVTATAGTGGSINPSSTSVPDGATTIFTLTPNSGYALGAVSGCGGNLSGNTYTTAPITAACSVAAGFTLIPVGTHTVTASASAGGGVSPSNVQAQTGDTVEFTLTPDSGYRVASVSGCNGIRIGGIYTTATITGACSVSATFEIDGPRFGPAPPVTINARELFTDVPLNIAPSAEDGDGNPLPVLLDGARKLRPGRHMLTWRTTDAQGRGLTIQQQLDIWPTVSLSNDLIVPFGESADYQLVLNGEAPAYPYSVNYNVIGDGYGTLHTLQSGAAVFTASETEVSVPFDALPQSTSMPTRRLIVSLDPIANIGERGSLSIDLTSENLAPQAQIFVTQGGRIGAMVARDGGPITLQLLIIDPNTGDTHSLQWAQPPAASAQISSDRLSLTVDPQSLNVGLHEFSVSVTDSGSPPLSSRARVVLALRASLPSLTAIDSNGNGIGDDIEGWGDSGNGIPAHLNRMTQRHVLPEDAPVTDRFLIEGDVGVRLRVGSYAQLNGGGGARLPPAEVAALIGVDTVTNVGGFFDVDAVELPLLGQSVQVVIPQRQPIPAHPVYRLWDAQQSKWYTFVENGSNRLSSAPGEEGYCPPPGSGAYTPGLTSGHWCVQITLEDGGANDGDRQENGALSFSGGIAKMENSVVTGTSDGGGGGAMGLFGIVLGLLAVSRAQMRRSIAATVSTCMLPLALHAADNDPQHNCKVQAVGCYYIGVTLGLAHNSDGASEMDDRLAAQGYVTQTDLNGQSRFAGALFGGYRWTRFAAEFGYAHLGRMDSRVEGMTPVDDDYLRAVSLAHPRSGEGLQASGLVFIPFNEQWEVFGRAGLFYWRNTLSAEGFSRYTDTRERQTDPYLGLGARLDPLYKNWSLRAEAQLYKLDGDSLTYFGIGLTYRLPW